MSKDLAQQTALVTGATAGIGRATAWPHDRTRTRRHHQHQQRRRRHPRPRQQRITVISPNAGQEIGSFPEALDADADVGIAIAAAEGAFEDPNGWSQAAPSLGEQGTTARHKTVDIRVLCLADNHHMSLITHGPRHCRLLLTTCRRLRWSHHRPTPGATSRRPKATGSSPTGAAGSRHGGAAEQRHSQPGHVASPCREAAAPQAWAGAPS